MSAGGGRRGVVEMQPSCPFGACDGSGWILGPEDVARPCQCRERRMARLKARGIASVIPRKYRDVSFELLANDGMDTRVLGAIKQFVEDLDAHLDAGKGLWLMGDVGTGKTAAAMLVSKKVLEAGRSVAIYSLPQLLARIRRTYETDAGDSYLPFVERLTSVDLLHLDDLGAERRTDWVLEQLYSIVNQRYESERAILVTMNSSADDFDPVISKGTQSASKELGWVQRLNDEIGERTVSRLVEICGDPLPLFGEDLRYRVAGT